MNHYLVVRVLDYNVIRESIKNFGNILVVGVVYQVKEKLELG